MSKLLLFVYSCGTPAAVDVNAARTAPEPPPPETVTVGAEVYPEPELDIVTL